MITQDVTLGKKVRIKKSSLFLRWKSLFSALGYELPCRLLTFLTIPASVSEEIASTDLNYFLKAAWIDYTIPQISL